MLEPMRRAWRSQHVLLTPVSGTHRSRHRNGNAHSNSPRHRTHHTPALPVEPPATSVTRMTAQHTRQTPQDRTGTPPQALETDATALETWNPFYTSAPQHTEPRTAGPNAPAAQESAAKRPRASLAALDAVFDHSDPRALRGGAHALHAGAQAVKRVKTAQEQAEDRRRTTAQLDEPRGLRTEGQMLDARWDLEMGALDFESHALADTTLAGYSTALNWWYKFIAHIGLAVHMLVFDASSLAARAAVISLARCFLQFTHRSGRLSAGGRPIDAETSLEYWARIVRLHWDHVIDLRFTLIAAKRWCAGTKRVITDTFGKKAKRKKAMFSKQQIQDVYETSWSAHGGKVNPKRRITVLQAAPQLAIQVLFRASEYLRGKEAFNRKVHLSRAHIRYFTWDWVELTPEQLTPEVLQPLLDSGRARATVRMPRLKNDQYLDRNFEDHPLQLNGGPICALRFMLLMEIADPLTSLAARRVPMFVDPDTGRSLTKPALAKVFTSLTHHVIKYKYKLNVSMQEVRKQWSLHSFRITGQNLLKEAGAPRWLIKQAGRWLSDCVFTYDRTSLEALSQYSAATSTLPTFSSPSLSIEGMPTYPYPVTTLHPDLIDDPAAAAVEGTGSYIASPAPAPGQHTGHPDALAALTEGRDIAGFLSSAP